MSNRRPFVDELFLREDEIARRLGQTPRDWESKAIVLEREGLPPKDPFFGLRYWPAVRAFLDHRYDLKPTGVHKVDGEEIWS
jgi:hypothetical protein